MNKENNINIVLERFKDVCQELMDTYSGGNIYKYWPILIDKYNRPYHNFDHIYSGLHEIGLLCLFSDDKKIKFLEEFVLAWILHDINVGCRQAELLSAMFAQHLIYDLNLVLKGEIVYDLIYETSPECYLIEGLSKTGLYEADLMHDIDFLQFGMEWDIFLKCNDNIDKEFGDRLDPIARGRFISLIQSMNCVFRTDLYREKYEKQAQENITRILNERYR